MCDTTLIQVLPLSWRHLHVAVIRTHPEHARFYVRFGDRRDAGPCGDAVVERERVAAFELLAHHGDFAAVLPGGEIFAEPFPGVAAIVRTEEIVAAEVNRFGIVRRNRHRRIPLEAVARILVAIFAGANGFRFARLQIAPRKVAVLRFGVNDVRVASGRCGYRSRRHPAP